MNYIIYEPASDGDIRHTQITKAARLAGFPDLDAKGYKDIIYHPTKNKAALEVVNIESVYYKDVPTQAYNFELFFTAQELAGQVPELSAEWTNSVIPE